MNETLKILIRRQSELQAELRGVNEAIRTIESNLRPALPQAVLDSTTTFKDRVVSLMTEKGISGRQLAKLIGRSPSYMTTILSGTTEVPSTGTVRALSEVLGVDLFAYVPNDRPDELRDRLRSAREIGESIRSNPNLGVKLRQARAIIGMTLSDAGERIGVTNQAVNQWEQGTTKPSLNNLMRAAEVYGADFGTFQNEAHDD